MFQMDCWDGPDGEPVIYHGWTLTSKIKFKDVIEQGIKPFAFTTSEYPLILSIENHCSKVQQDKMGKHLLNILGHFLYKEKVDTSLQNLPSPEFFKRKILIKAKKQKDPKGKILREIQSSPNLSDDSADIVRERNFSNESEVNRLSVSTESRLLSDIVNYVEAIKFTSFKAKRKFWQMSSFNETQIIEILNTAKKEFTQYTEKYLCRIYPKGSRLLSSNLSRQKIVKGNFR